MSVHNALFVQGAAPSPPPNIFEDVFSGSGLAVGMTPNQPFAFFPTWRDLSNGALASESGGYLIYNSGVNNSFNIWTGFYYGDGPSVPFLTTGNSYVAHALYIHAAPIAVSEIQFVFIAAHRVDSPGAGNTDVSISLYSAGTVGNVQVKFVVNGNIQIFNFADPGPGTYEAVINFTKTAQVLSFMGQTFNYAENYSGLTRTELNHISVALRKGQKLDRVWATN